MFDICFFHVGKRDPAPEILCESLKLAYRQRSERPRLIHLKDSISPPVDGADLHLSRGYALSQQICYERFVSYLHALKSIGGPIVFLDTDMMFIRPLEESCPFFDKPLLCRREFGRKKLVRPELETSSGVVKFPSHQGKTFDELFPVLACFLGLAGPLFMEVLNKKYELLSEDYKRWYGDQVVLRDLSLEIPCEFVGESTYACLPEMVNEVGVSNVCLVHYKGLRKTAMLSDWSDFKSRHF